MRSTKELQQAIAQIEDIELSARQISDSFDSKKQALTERYAADTLAFDRELEEQTSTALEEIRSQIEAQIASRLSAQNTSDEIAYLRSSYEELAPQQISLILEEILKY